MRLDYFLYMNEAEGTGLINTHTAKVNKLIKELRTYIGYGDDPNEVWIEVCYACGLDPHDLTDSDKRRINREVFR